MASARFVWQRGRQRTGKTFGLYQQPGRQTAHFPAHQEARHHFHQQQPNASLPERPERRKLQWSKRPTKCPLYLPHLRSERNISRNWTAWWPAQDNITQIGL